ncbi:MAG TPA: TonB-dependent receptor [Rhizomicrobium sp.]|nr:TonB-dependent receptor [Rhizomicrobium sp.]
MNNLCKHLMLGGSTAALMAIASASVVYAQENSVAPETETTVVSASRITIQGYTQPTPVTVISAESLQRDAKTDIGDAIRELPSVGISDSPGNGSHAGNASQGDAGIDTINLRSLGVVRTLVLFDGQRVATSNPNASAPPAIGGVDLSTIPTTVIERVDVVTGGASAAWGSDAVAGVVNLVINKHFTGLKANVVYGNDSYGDHESFRGELTWGADLMGDRLHTEFAGTYTMSPNTMFNWSRPWYNGSNRGLYPCALTGGSGASLCHTPSAVYSTSFTNGGLITNSAAGSAATVTSIGLLGQNYTGLGSAVGTPQAAAGVLKGNQFVGATGVAPFNYGISSGTNCYNCSAGPLTDITNGPLTAVPYHNVTLFNYTSYKVTNDITASVMLNYGYNAEQNQANNGRQSSQTIGIDNPFLPASLRAEMIAGGIPSFSLGTAANENMLASDVLGAASLSKAYVKAIGENYIQNYRQLMRGVFTLTGDYKLMDQDWSWNAYAQHTLVREWQYAPFNTLGANFANAVDAVTVTATGKDSLGADQLTGLPGVIGPSTPGWDPTLNSGAGGFKLLNGTILNAGALLSQAVTANLISSGAHVPQVGEAACRSALTATTWGIYNAAGTGFTTIKNGTTNTAGGIGGGLMAGCVPLNLFGDGNTSQGALNYIAPGRTNKGVEDQALYRINQSVFSVSTQGVLPWGLPAGKVAVATGFEDRLEQQRVQRDPLQLGQSGAWESGNFAQYAGEYSVEEGFLELDVPVLKDDIVQSLDFNAAGRITSYSTSGLVETWKLGATSQVNDDIRLRTTLSSDIRAPGIGELFQSPLISTQTIVYPPSGPNQQNYNVHFGAAGNQSLVPEQALTVSGGIVLTPHWIENLSLSLDWYSITLHGGIFAPSSGQIFDQCANHAVAAFCALIFKGVGWPGNANTPVASEVDLNGNSPGLSSIYGTFTANGEGAINFYLQSPVNANRETVSGLDFQADYRNDLFDGSMDWHLVGNYTDEKTRTSLGITVDGAGAVSGDSAVNPLTGFTEPKLRFTLSTTYAEGSWTLTAQSRLIGSALLSNTYNTPGNPTVDDNSVPAVIYGDIRASWRFSDKIQFYTAIDNVFNAPPPNLATASGGGTDCRIYDCIGRSYRIGIRFDD